MCWKGGWVGLRVGGGGGGGLWLPGARVHLHPCAPDLGIGTRSCRLRSISQIRTVASEVCEFEYKQTPTLGMEYPDSDHRAVSRSRCAEGLHFLPADSFYVRGFCGQSWLTLEWLAP